MAVGILDLPNELLLNVTGYAQPQDLLSLRSTCRTLCSGTFVTFASTFASDRSFPLSRQGMSSLLKFSNSEFAPYLKTLIIVQGGRNRPAKYHELLDQALKNFCTFRKLSAIGVRRTRSGGNVELEERYAHKNIDAFFEKNVFGAAQKYKLPIQNIIYEVGVPETVSNNQSSNDNKDMEQWRFHYRDGVTAAKSLVSPSHFLPSHVKRTIRFVEPDSKSTWKSTTTMTFSHDSGCSQVSHLDPQNMRFLEDCWQGRGSIKRLELYHCDIFEFLLADCIEVNKLEAVAIHDVRLWMDDESFYRYLPRQLTTVGDRGGWRRLLTRLREANPYLSYCRISDLKLGSNDFEIYGMWQASGTEDVQACLRDLASKGWSRRSFLVGNRADRHQKDIVENQIKDKPDP